jgi:hypothetical protein
LVEKVGYILNIKSVNIYSIPFIFSTTLLLYKLDTLLLKHSGEKRNPLYPIRAVSFVSIVLYLILSNMASIEKFVSNRGNPAIVMLTTKSNLPFLCQNDVQIFGDGTFQYCALF